MNISRHVLAAVVVATMIALLARAAADGPPDVDLSGVPGVVINHLPATTGIYVGSPSIAILPNGDYIATHDEFGPKSSEHQRAITHVFRSIDRGATWRPLAAINGQFWSTLYYHRDALYLIGTNKHHGNLIIRRSEDGGTTWSDPTDPTTGLLAEGQYHCAPQPVVVHRGRIWRAMEDAAGGVTWGERYRPFMMSAPIDANLLHRESWTFSNRLPGDKAWLGGNFRGWLEGNAVVDPRGEIVNVLRVAGTDALLGKAALTRVAIDGQQIQFDPTTGFIDFPGGCKKFTIRHDAQSNRYWSLSNWVMPEDVGKRGAGSIRNTLALVSSPDLHTWRIDRVILHDPDLDTGFQYADWHFDGTDIIATVRTAHDDGVGGAHNNHDANLLTFHRIHDFRNTPTGEDP